MLIHVKIEPESKEDSIEVKNNTSLLVKVKDEAKQNAANKKMLSLLAKHFNTNKIKIITGHHAPSKIVEVSE